MSNERPPNPLQFVPAPETEPDAQAVQDIAERLNEITECANRSVQWLNAGYAVSLLCILLGTCLIPMWLGRHNPLSSPIVFLSILLWAIGMCLTLWVSARKAPRFDAEEIAQLGGTQAIAPLFAALRATSSPPLLREMRDALTLLLPQMKASDASLLTPTSRKTIRGLLIGVSPNHQKYECEDALRIAMLKALEQVGNAKDIPIVEKLIQRNARTPGEKLVRQAAMECLPMLLINCGEVEAARTLLRPSQAEAAHSATLLRPAGGAGQMDSAELLRGAQPPDTQD